MNFGGPSNPLGRDFLQKIRDTVRLRILGPLRDTVQIEFATLGGDAGPVHRSSLARIPSRVTLGTSALPISQRAGDFAAESMEIVD
jgi:hypothetical protein